MPQDELTVVVEYDPVTVQIDEAVPPTNVTLISNMGPPGPQGDQGPPGADSTVPGPKGDTGDTGPQGPQGIKGDTGDTGPAGADGATGPQGDPGPAGVDGTDGATWYSGSGAPSSGLGTVDDWYFDIATGDVYLKTGSSTWSFEINLVGPQGATGATGATGPKGDKGDTGDTGPAGAAGTNGSTWYSGSGAPASGTGVDGDYYFDTANGDVYLKVSGSWGSPIANLTGPAGSGGSGVTIYEQTDQPSSANDGDIWIDSDGTLAASPDVAGETHAASNKTTPVDDDELALADSAASYVLKKLTWVNLKTTLKAYFDSLYGAGSLDGWIDDSAETWTYASGSGGGTATFTVPGDKTAKYTVGTRIKLTQTTVKYFVVSADPTYDGTNTTVTITAGSDYTLANVAITNIYHSYVSNPQGYPGRFNFNASTSGITSPTVTSQFSVMGRTCTIFYSASGTSNSTSKGFTLPIKQAIVANFNYPLGVVEDNGSFAVGAGRVQINGSTTSAVLFKDNAGNSWTASGAWLVSVSFTYGI